MHEINVLHLINSFQDSSISRIILRLIENFGIEGICWHVGGLSYFGETQNEFDRLNAKTIDFSKNNNLRKYIISNGIKIIHTHTPRTIFSASLALRGISNIVHISTKHLLTKPDDRKWGFLITLLDRLSLYFPDRLIPVSQVMYHQIVRQPGINSNRVTLIQNAIPCEQYFAPEQRLECRKELGIPLDSMVLGYIGRIQKVKRIDLLLTAINQIRNYHPNIHLIITGEGDARNRLQLYAEELGISNHIIWTGFRQDIPRILSALDLYIQTSTNEGLSLSLLEAMAAGKTIITTEVGGNSEIIKHDINGWLLKNDSINEIVNAAIFLIDHPEVRERLSATGFEYVKENFSLNSMVAGYRNLYKQIFT